MTRNPKINSGLKFRGEYRLVKLRAKPKWIPRDWWLSWYRAGLLNSMVISKSPVISNLVVFNTDHGAQLILQHLAGDTTYPLNLDNASIGTGTTAAADTDTDLETPEVEDIPRVLVEINTDNIYTEWFIPSDELPNDTYTEFGLFAGTQLFARSIISPSFTKGNNEDALVEYTIYAGNAAP